MDSFDMFRMWLVIAVLSALGIVLVSIGIMIGLALQ